MKSLPVILVISATVGLLGGLLLGGATGINSKSADGRNSDPDRVATSFRRESKC